MAQKKVISWVLPIFNEATNIPQLYTALQKLSTDISDTYAAEFIFVNDGSRDNSLEMLTQLYEKDPRVTVISFSRNFGHQMAITAGLDHARGDAVIFMDSDLQDPPQICLDLIKEWEAGYDVVYAKRRSRKDGFMKKLTAYVFYRILHSFADVNIPEDVGDFRLISRQVADVLRGFPERHRFIRGLVSYIGFKQKAVLFDREDRKSGKTGYSLKKMLRLAQDALTGFSLAPITMLGTAGGLLMALGLVADIYATAYGHHTIAAAGFNTILTGIILVALSVLGQYVGRTYQEAQHRPLYIISTLLTRNGKQHKK